jgi:hypothetical protein
MKIHKDEYYTLYFNANDEKDERRAVKKAIEILKKGKFEFVVGEIDYETGLFSAIDSTGHQNMECVQLVRTTVKGKIKK